MTRPAVAEALARSGSLTLTLPECPKGIGSVITAVDSPKLIAGIRIQALALWPDDRGYFLEVQRIGHGLAAHFPPATSQVSAALNYPGSIKADTWEVAGGKWATSQVSAALNYPGSIKAFHFH